MGKKISVVIIAQDDEERIANAIRSCQPFADEVLVVDGGSRDGTREVAERAGARVVVNPWPGYAKQRNHGASLARNDWVFCLDSDEQVDADLASAFIDWKKEWHDGKMAFAVCRIGDFWGRWLFSAKEKGVVRLYNRHVYTILDTPVHEKPNAPPKYVQQLKGIIWHEGFRSIDDHVKRFNRYTTLEAQKDADAARCFSLLRLLIRPVAQFLRKYFYQRLFRYGMAGLAVAYLWFMYEILRELKLYEHEQRARIPARLQPSNGHRRERVS